MEKSNDLKRVFDSSRDHFVRLGKALMAIAEWSIFDGNLQKIVPVTFRFMENVILCRIGGKSVRGSETNSNLHNHERRSFPIGLNDLHHPPERNGIRYLTGWPPELSECLVTP
jgi:hypothetical protein